MKNIYLLLIITSAALFTNCSKSGSTIVPINCDGLITDTLGTGDNGRIYMPNAFTPNSDGLNEICRPVTQNIDSITFTIYDENNVVLFTTSVPGEGWLPPTSSSRVKKYYYKIQTKTISGKKIGQCGEVYSLTCFTVNPPKSYYYFEDMLTPGGFTGATLEDLSTCR